MITTLSKQGGRRYPQMGGTWLAWAGRLPSVGETTAPPVPVVDIPMGGAGYPVYRKRTLADRPNEHLRQILDRVVSEYYGEIVASDVPQSVKKEAAAIVKPFAEKQARFKSVPPVAQVDWTALQRDADAVSAILRIWYEELSAREADDDDDDILMMMH